MRPYRELFRAILGASLSPQNELGVLGINTGDVRAQSGNVFLAVVTAAIDTPQDEYVRDLAIVLHAAQLAILLFWLYDSTRNQYATEELLGFAGDMLNMGRRLLRAPPIARALKRLARAIEPVLGPWQ